MVRDDLTGCPVPDISGKKRTNITSSNWFLIANNYVPSYNKNYFRMRVSNNFLLTQKCMFCLTIYDWWCLTISNWECLTISKWQCLTISVVPYLLSLFVYILNCKKNNKRLSDLIPKVPKTCRYCGCVTRFRKFRISDLAPFWILVGASLYYSIYFKVGGGYRQFSGVSPCLERSGLPWMMCVGIKLLRFLMGSNVAEIYFIGHILVSMKRQTIEISPMLAPRSLERRQRYNITRPERIDQNHIY
jgi:hypothetical protein